ncbi:tyrosine-type recombinase/integrase [Alienimonas californiensis]|uniref:Site-specific tyrosine recombinase XerC n=1 Tax=Alienimonas californiensis TaxID=2527989 RepID=A0A517P5F2_9PLAN|nr:tyrosine-type recombinase/integrase [Alienimonas californiensis]QDT14602.1 site-specific tyrosine recombinase XerC [Alienimonas californiensis]
MIDKPIRVTVFKRDGRTNYEAQWTDPLSGKTKMKSTGHRVKRDAERWAGRWEKELNDGAAGAGRATWADLVTRAERDFLPDKREKTRDSYRTAIGDVQRHLRPKLLTEITPEAIGRLKAGLRDGGVAPATVASKLRHVKALLRWAERQGMIDRAPAIEMPKVEAAAKGRPITDAEFAKVLAAVPDVVGESRAASWRHLLRGLWLSGLRMGEATALTWDDLDGPHVRLGGPFPAFLIPGRMQKGGKDTVTPIVPDFLAFLQGTPEADRRGFVFNPAPVQGTDRLSADWTSRTVAAIGTASGVKVKGDEPARAHDLRRSFCFRWSQRVLPQQLRVLARHTAVQTTLTYYAEADAGMTAEAVAAAVRGLGAG